MSEYLTPDESRALWKKIMSEISKLPSLPEMIILLLKELKQKDSTPESLEQIIINDASLSAKILRVANSAHYAQSQHIDTISRAIVLLGINTIRNIALTITTSGALTPNMKGYGLEKGELFIHSLATAAGAGYLAKHTRFAEPEMIFVAGLLHDIGKILLSPYIQAKLNILISIEAKDDKPFNAAERAVFGFNHCDLGEVLAQQWQLPKVIADANKFHHNPAECPEDTKKIIEYIHISDYIAYQCKFGLGVDGNNYKITEEIFEKYKINETRMENFMDAVRAETNELYKSVVVV